MQGRLGGTMDTITYWFTQAGYWIMWAQAHPAMATVQITGTMTIAVAFLNQLGLTKLAEFISNLEDAILAAQTAARTAFVTSFKAGPATGTTFVICSKPSVPL